MKQILDILLTDKQAEIELDRSMHQESYYHFFLDYWNVVEPDIKLVDNWHIKYLCEKLQDILFKVSKREDKEKDLVINIPPGTTKSTIVSIIFPVWCWVINPQLKIITVSEAQPLANKFSARSRDLIQSEKFKEQYPEFRIKQDRNRINDYALTQGGYRYAVGVGSTIIGNHGDIIIIDDPLSVENAFSKIARFRANRYIEQTLPTRVTDKKNSAFILVMQRLHQQDPTSIFIERDNVNHICLPAELSEAVKPPELKEHYKKQGGLLDPIRLDKKVLKGLFDTLKLYGYNAQIKQTPITLEGNLFKKKSFRYYNENDKMYILNKKTEIVRYPKENCLVFASVDLAISQTETADFTVVQIWAFTPKAELLLIDQIREKFSGAEHLPALKKAKDLYGVQFFAIENVQFQQSLVDQVNASGMTATPIPANGDKVIRSLPFVMAIENEQCFFPENKSFMTEYEEELLGFPDSTHKDQVDAGSIAFIVKNKGMIGSNKNLIRTSSRLKSNSLIKKR